MSFFNHLKREFSFLLRQPAALIVLTVALLLSVISVGSGLITSAGQKATIERLLAADLADRTRAIAKESDIGGAAYYSKHLTYDPPSPLAFAAHGERDVFPWKHRVRMLAIEGQIYESDTMNPDLAQAGQFDFALMVSVLMPLFVIMLLHDQRAAERVAGRHDLLAATAGSGSKLWLSRAAVRIVLLTFGVLTPFIVGAVISGAEVQSTLLVCLISLAGIGFWSFICLWASARNLTGPAIASFLLAFWTVTTFVVPAIGEAVIENVISAPEGGDIVLAQRETVNGAWDLPKEETMNLFIKAYPEWADYTQIEKPFEWKWYYAFQQVGDQSVAEISKQRRDALIARHNAAKWVVFFSPSAAIQRSLTRLAMTDIKAALSYQNRVRDFHASLRAFYYPLLFKDISYEEDLFSDLPEYTPYP